MFNRKHPLTAIPVKFRTFFFSSKFYYETTHKKLEAKKKGIGWKGWFYAHSMYTSKWRKLIEFSWDLSEILCEFLFNFKLYFIRWSTIGHSVQSLWRQKFGKALWNLQLRWYAFWICFFFISIFSIRFCSICSKDALDSLNEAFIAIGFIHVKPLVT